jgi:putative transposase
MAKTEHYYTQFEAGGFYHVYNRTIDQGKLFANYGNYVFFLKKFDEYLSVRKFRNIQAI